MLVPWFHISRLLYCEKVNFLCLSYPIYGILLCQPKGTKIPHISFSSLCLYLVCYCPIGQNKSHIHLQIMSGKNLQNSREGIHWSLLHSKSNRERKVDLDIWVKETEFSVSTVDYGKTYWQEKYISSFSLWWVTLINFAVQFFFPRNVKLPGVFVSWGLRNKIPKTRWLK